MAKLPCIPEVNFAEARAALSLAVEANQPVLLLGDPGVGKTALAREVAAQAGRDLETLLGSTVDPTDVGGIPVVRVDGKGVDRVPLALIERCCERPSILFLDEISCAPPSVQAALLRLVLERVAGDRPLHPETRVLAAANPPEQAPGGFELSAPLMGRVASLWLRPSLDEVCGYFTSLGEEGSHLRAEATDFGLTAQYEPRMLQVDIPQESVSGNRPWGAPRAWERVVRARAVAAARGLPAESPTTHALACGSVGEECAKVYRAVLNVRHKLPCVADILRDPEEATLPAEEDLQLAALGLVGRVADENVWAAWTFAGRLREEYGVAAMRMLMQRSRKEACADDLPHFKVGLKVRATMAAKMARLTKKRAA